MGDNSVEIEVDGVRIRTLRDVLPEEPGVEVLFIGKVPAPKSVAIGHYFQGRQGQMFWRRLTDYGLFRRVTEFEDDSLLAHGYGITDIVKVPRVYGDEPSAGEYAAGTGRILSLIELHSPRVLVFVYKRVLDVVLRARFGIMEKSTYGFNPSFEELFGSRLFVFPLPGTPCTSSEAAAAMRELASVVKGPKPD